MLSSEFKTLFHWATDHCWYLCLFILAFKAPFLAATLAFKFKYSKRTLLIVLKDTCDRSLGFLSLICFYIKYWSSNISFFILFNILSLTFFGLPEPYFILCKPTLLFFLVATRSPDTVYLDTPTFLQFSFDLHLFLTKPVLLPSGYHIVDLSDSHHCWFMFYLQMTR